MSLTNKLKEGIEDIGFEIGDALYDFFIDPVVESFRGNTQNKFLFWEWILFTIITSVVMYFCFHKPLWMVLLVFFVVGPCVLFLLWTPIIGGLMIIAISGVLTKVCYELFRRWILNFLQNQWGIDTSSIWIPIACYTILFLIIYRIHLISD